MKTPATLFCLTQALCESPCCDVDLVWNIVLRTMGVEALLQSAFDRADKTDLNDIRKEDIMQNVLSLEPEDRAPLWDGVFFLTFFLGF